MKSAVEEHRNRKLRKSLLLVLLTALMTLSVMVYVAPLKPEKPPAVSLKQGEGKNLDAIIEASQEKPQLLVFLRHFG